MTRIRAATPHDVIAISALVADAYAPYVSRMGRPPAPMLSDYGALVAAGKVTVIEAASDAGADHIVGVLVAWIIDDACYVDTVAVDTSVRGTGLGRQLLDEADNLARAAGLRRVWLYTNAAMTENLEFYPRQGFNEFDRRCDNGYDRVFYERHVSP